MKTGYVAAIAVLAMLALAVVPAIGEDADATAHLDTTNNYFEFDNMNGGTLTFGVDNLGGGSFVMDVVVKEGDREVASKSGINIPAGEKTEVSIKMSDFKSVGTHTLTIVCTPESQFPPMQNTNTVTVEVTKNLLSNWVTYVVIIIVIIVVAVFIYLKIRDSPKKKVDMTFEQLEEQRKAEMATKGDKKRKTKEAAPTTERQRYLADKKKKE